MLKRGELKFISSVDDPDLLFDLAADPLETINVATDPAYASHVQWFKETIAQTWDNDLLTKDILLSQKRRQLLIEAAKSGNAKRWDHNETEHDNVPWYRGTQGYNQWAYNYTPVPANKA